MKLQILGSGCKKCQKLEANVVAAAQVLGIEIELEKITDTNAIIDHGVMRTPAFAVDGEVLFEGKIATVEEMQSLLAEHGFTAASP